MKINIAGVTRMVFEFKNIVIKIPNCTYSWQHFLKGLIANIAENQTWKYNSGKYEKGKSYLLCPVLWCSWGGWILIMKKADVFRHEAEIRLSPSIGNIQAQDEVKRRYKKWIEAGLHGDDKCSNYGYINDRLVKIDYGQ